MTGERCRMRAGWWVDCKRLRSLTVDRDRMTVTCGAGWNGWHLEEALNRQGCPIGHFPSSIMCSTGVAGWRRGAPGNVDEVRQDREHGVIADGDRHGRAADGGQDAQGTGLGAAVCGKRGRLGFQVMATLSLVAVPQKRLLRGYWFPDIAGRAAERAPDPGAGGCVRRWCGCGDELDTRWRGRARAGQA